MNSGNDNTVKIGLVAVLLLGGFAYLGYNLFWVPLTGANEAIDRLEEANADKQAQITGVLKDQKKLQIWRALSLPGVENLPAHNPKSSAPKMAPEQAREEAARQAQDRYVAWLRDLLKKNKIENADPKRGVIDYKATPHAVNGQPVYSSMLFTVNIPEAKLADLVKMLREFQATPLLHRIRGLTLKQIDSAKITPETVSALLTVEALIVNGSRKRGDPLESPPNLMALNQPAKTLEWAMIALRRRPSAIGVGFIPWTEIYGLATMAPKRKYEDIPKKNIFEGALPVYVPPPVEPKKEIVGPPRPPKDQRPPARPTEDLISFVHLTDVTAPPAAAPWASVFSRATEKLLKVRAQAGSDTIPLVISGDGRAVVHGKVLHIDPRGIIFRVGVAAEPPEESAKSRFKNAKVIYALAKEDVADLVKLGTIKPDEADRTYKMHRAFWEGMINDKVVKLTGKKGTDFAFRWDLVKGKVTRGDDKWVVVTLPEKYCSFAVPDDDEAVRTHAGYCYFSLGESLMDALETPWDSSQVQGLLAAAANRKQ